MPNFLQAIKNIGKKFDLRGFCPVGLPVVLFGVILCLAPSVWAGEAAVSHGMPGETRLDFETCVKLALEQSPFFKKSALSEKPIGFAPRSSMTIALSPFDPITAPIPPRPVFLEGSPSISVRETVADLYRLSPAVPMEINAGFP